MTPELEILAFNDLTTSIVLAEGGGLLELIAFPADDSFRLMPRQRVPVELAASSGDREAVGLYRRTCPARERAWQYDCFRFGILMAEGRDARELLDHVAAIGGRFNLISVSGRIAAVTLFSPDDVVGHARRARSWPNVETTELSFPFCQLASGSRCGSPAWLAMPVRVDVGDPVIGDGTLQVRSGDTLTVTYRQPNGGVVSSSIVLR